MGMIKNAKKAKKIMDTIPNVKSPMGLILFIVNIFLPGIGTIIGAIITKAGGMTYLVGVLQLVLTIILVGWIWSIAWGWFMFDRSSMKKAVKAGVKAVS